MNNISTEDIKTIKLGLWTDGLCSKYGFSESIADFEEKSNTVLDVDNNELLIALCEKYVIPNIKENIKVNKISTSHNPIRIVEVNGKEVDNIDGDEECVESKLIEIDAVDVFVECRKLGGNIYYEKVEGINNITSFEITVDDQRKLTLKAVNCNSLKT